MARGTTKIKASYLGRAGELLPHVVPGLSIATHGQSILKERKALEIETEDKMGI